MTSDDLLGVLKLFFILAERQVKQQQLKHDQTRTMEVNPDSPEMYCRVNFH
jgi:hypothetical protein